MDDTGAPADSSPDSPSDPAPLPNGEVLPVPVPEPAPVSGPPLAPEPPAFEDDSLTPPEPPPVSDPAPAAEPPVLEDDSLTPLEPAPVSEPAAPSSESDASEPMSSIENAVQRIVLEIAAEGADETHAATRSILTVESNGGSRATAIRVLDATPEWDGEAEEPLAEETSVTESPEEPELHEVSLGKTSSSNDLFSALVHCVHTLAAQTATEQECIPVTHVSLIASASADKSHSIDLTGAVLVGEVTGDSHQIK